MIIPLLLMTVSLEQYATLEPQYPSYVSRNQYGLCLRAACPLPAGTIVATANFEVTHKPYIANHPDPDHRYVGLMHVSKEGIPIWGKVRGKWAFCNHSCEPNCILNTQWQTITNRMVQKDEELTTAYDAFIPNFPWPDSWNFVCLCGSKKCKRLIKEYRMDIQAPLTP